jgi:hypothetical protein
LPYLEAVAITFTRQAKWFLAIHEIRFTPGLDPSYKDEILPKRRTSLITNEVNLITGPYLNTEYWVSEWTATTKAALTYIVKR